ncbi:unnamed protein product, partial [marine sediment metagenome]
VDDDVLYYNPDAGEVTNISIRDISIYGNRENNASGNGIHFGDNAGDIAFTRVGVKYTKEHGIFCEYAWGIVVMECIVEYCDGDAVNMLGGNDVRIIGNKIGASEGYGIYLTGSRHKIMGNLIFGNTEAGGYVYAKETAIVGNVIQNNEGTTDDCQLYLRGSAIVVMGNTIAVTSQTGYGIVLRAGSNNCDMRGNTISDYNTARILDPGARNLYNGLSISRGAPETQLDTGTAEDGSTSQLIDTDQVWIAKEWQGCMVEITGGAAAGDIRT